MSRHYRETNRAAWDRLVRGGSSFAHTATDEELADPLGTLDRRGWLPKSVRGWRVLCLAAGGGWQSILYAAAGAEVTVLDLSPEMLALDRREADRRGLSIKIVEGSMDDLGSFAVGEFDLVHQPVSTCYIPEIETVYREIARVTRPGGLYISQHKQPTSLQVTHRSDRAGYVVGVGYYRTGPLPPTEDVSYREPHATEYLHRWEQLVGGLCRNGFVLEDLTEPYRGDPAAPVGHFKHRGCYLAPYVRLKARRIDSGTDSASSSNRSPLWIPDL